jgi:hypothetical protein
MNEHPKDGQNSQKIEEGRICTGLLLNMMYLRRFIWPAAAPAVPFGGSR